MNPNNLHDLVIRNGKIFDGSGGKPFIGDVAIDDGKISLVGVIEGSGRKEIDAKGNLVTPGWVDIHTHYDGQVCWDPYLTPSSWHGVTTVVMGNCGVGFAPVKPGDENFLINTHVILHLELLPVDSVVPLLILIFNKFLSFFIQCHFFDMVVKLDLIQRFS